LRERQWHRPIVLIPMVILIIIIIASGSFLSSSLANGQLTTINGNATAAKPLPGYLSDATVWKTLEDLLRKVGIPFYAVTLHRDNKFGSAADHANESSTVVQNVKRITGKSAKDSLS
jgi:hypothetical protein